MRRCIAPNCPSLAAAAATPTSRWWVSLCTSLWCGANRFEHLEVTRFDAVLGKVFAYERMANDKAFTRLLNKRNQAQRLSTTSPRCTSTCLSRCAYRASPWVWNPYGTVPLRGKARCEQ
jgi:hypothetical protein